MTFIIYAIIKENKVIDFFVTPYGNKDPNFAEIQAEYGIDCDIIECTNYPIVCEDEYRDGKFYRNGEEITRLLSDHEEIDNLKTLVGRQEELLQVLFVNQFNLAKFASQNLTEVTQLYISADLTEDDLDKAVKKKLITAEEKDTIIYSNPKCTG